MKSFAVKAILENDVSPEFKIGNKNYFGEIDFLWFVFSVVLDFCGRSTSRHAPRRLNPSQQGKRILASLSDFRFPHCLGLCL